MSHVDTVILTTFLEESNLLDEVNKFFGDSAGFEDVTEMFGGDKQAQMNVAIGAFNYLEVEDLVAHIWTIPWESPGSVQLMICGEHEERFANIPIGEK